MITHVMIDDASVTITDFDGHSPDLVLNLEMIGYGPASKVEMRVAERHFGTLVDALLQAVKRYEIQAAVRKSASA